MLTILVKTVDDSPAHHTYLAQLWKETSGGAEDVYFDFSGCRFLGQNAVAFLGGLARLVQSRGKRVWFAWHTMTEAVATDLMESGFMKAFGAALDGWRGDTIPYREDATPSAHEFAAHLTLHWLGRGWINVSTALRDAIVGRVSEAYSNVFEHARS